MISYLVYHFFNIIVILMLLRVLLSWFSINWYQHPFDYLKNCTDFIFEPFRRLIPPIGMLDISPIFAFIVVYILQNLAIKLLGSIGL